MIQLFLLSRHPSWNNLKASQFSKKGMQTAKMDLRSHIFEKGTKVMHETGDESHRTLQAISKQVVEQVRQPKPEVPHPAMEMPRQIHEAPILALETMAINLSTDLRSVAKNRSLFYAQRNLADEDLRWFIEAQRSRHNRSIRSDRQRLKEQGRIIVTRNFNVESTRPHLAGTRSPRMVKPPLRSPSKRWEKVSHLEFPTQNPRTLRRRLQHKKVKEWKMQQKQVEAKESSFRRPHQPAKRNMVWMRKEKKEAASQTLLEGEDQSPTSPKVASVIVGANRVFKVTFETQKQYENPRAKSEERSIVYEFPKQTEEKKIVVPAQDDEEEDMANKIAFEKPEEKMARHIRSLYINAHMDETPINYVLVDNGAAINVLPTYMLYEIGKSLDDLVHTDVIISDFIRG
ncbi:hypothetical protein SLEP1_g22696 [Rubroshorea leprosula]|uniref:Uncharacterized protein n=1 Tax=Rubroshorea leprosula TaxID=152421 RepID=A0AAV5JHA4_9ROSI|nr:hypothetical protein SLEP1_g22696 [Rubroshorea leprosula]